MLNILKNTNTVYFCAGARNQSLLPYFENKNIQFENDERSAAFKALGVTKFHQGKKSVIICTTSGTAVSECLPALLEAHYSALPLILITGDRPKKLQLTGSPQTTKHELITQAAIRDFREVELHELQNLNLLNCQYPLHINVLIDDTTSHEEKIQSCDPKSYEEFEYFLKNHGPTLFLLSHNGEDLRNFAEKLRQYPIHLYAETLSWAKSFSTIQNEDELLHLFEKQFFKSVIRLGQTPLSKIWRLLEKNQLPVFHIDDRNLSALSYGKIWPKKMSDCLIDEKFWSILSRTINHSQIPNIEVNSHHKSLDEEQLIHQYLQEIIPIGSHIYLGNSLVIRNFEYVQKDFYRTYGNRGLNGIDGQLSTAIGIATELENRILEENNRTLYCLLGDMTCLYDLSSFREISKNLKLIIFNNQGGRIFEKLNLDKRLVLEHQFSFQKISEAFNLNYCQIPKDFFETSLSLNKEQLKNILSENHIIEITISSKNING